MHREAKVAKLVDVIALTSVWLEAESEPYQLEITKVPSGYNLFARKLADESELTKS